ncbi:type II toxin-antitoxin system RelE family toxin [Desulfobacca acetoxidans]
MIYRIEITRKADKAIGKLDKKTIGRILARLDELAINPFDHRISGPVEMGQGERKSRLGDWRIIFAVDQTNHIINVIAIRPRKRAYPKQ